MTRVLCLVICMLAFTFGMTACANKSASLNDANKVCLLKVGDISVYLSSLEEAEELLNTVIKRYDTEGKFVLSLDKDKYNNNEQVEPLILRKDGAANMLDYVSLYGEGVGTGFYPNIPTGMVGLGFEQAISVKSTAASQNELSNWEDALSELTKDKEKNEIYVVEAGDCLGLIAQNLDMELDRLLELNNFENEGEILHVGDELIVSVPEPTLSVLTNVVETKEEEYTAETIYKDNDNWYTTKEVVISEAESGSRVATRSIISKNGREDSRNLIAETVIKESVAAVVEKGTQVPPTYIKPLNGGVFSSAFEMRWGKMHKGVDWACSTGTPVFASCRGVVTRAEFSSSYGYVVYIDHPDGRQTRYAHNSKLACSLGQEVKQGEVIAYSGSTGNSTGPHVHFEILINGVQVNPLRYLS